MRSMLFVPGDRPERFAKALASGADAVICDLEDAVTPVTRPQARLNVADLLRLPGKGRIAVGADADLVALDASGAVTDVFAGGRPHLRDGAVLRRGTFESQDT